MTLHPTHGRPVAEASPPIAHRSLSVFFIRDVSIALLFVSTVLFIYLSAAREHFQLQSLSAPLFVQFLKTERPVVVDLRETGEIVRFPFVYRPTIHLPFLQFANRISQLTLDPSQKYVLVCNDGNRSRLIATFLAKSGVSVHYLENGLWSLTEEQLRAISDEQMSQTARLPQPNEFRQ